MHFNQLADSKRILLAVPMACDGIGATGGVNSDFRPNYARRYLHRSNLGYRNALIVAAEHSGFNAADTLRGYDDPGRKYEIALSPTACRKGLGRRSRRLT